MPLSFYLGVFYTLSHIDLKIYFVLYPIAYNVTPCYAVTINFLIIYKRLTL